MGLMQERHNSIANALELCLSCTHPSVGVPCSLNADWIDRSSNRHPFTQDAPFNWPQYGSVNPLRPRQNGRHFADDTFKRIFLNENVRISLRISLKFVPKVRNNNIPSLVQIMAWRLVGAKPLSEPMLLYVPTIYASLGLNELKHYWFS